MQPDSSCRIAAGGAELVVYAAESAGLGLAGLCGTCLQAYPSGSKHLLGHVSSNMVYTCWTTGQPRDS